MSETLPDYMGCPWPVDPACFGDEWAAMDDAVKERAVHLASSALHRLTGGRVSNCPVTVRPRGSNSCFVPTSEPWYAGPMSPGMDTQGRWVNNCGPVCSDPTSAIRLPRPVGRIDSVKVDGVVLDPTEYRLLDHNMLVYVGTGDGWPVSQDVTRPDTEVGTFSVSYVNGYPPDATAAWAAGLLAAEFARACNNDKKCRLPAGVVSVVRQGVALDIAAGVFPGGVTGIREVDIFIHQWNPRGQLQPTTVWFPGVNR